MAINSSRTNVNYLVVVVQWTFAPSWFSDSIRHSLHAMEIIVLLSRILAMRPLEWYKDATMVKFWGGFSYFWLDWVFNVLRIAKGSFFIFGANFITYTLTFLNLCATLQGHFIGGTRSQSLKYLQHQPLPLLWRKKGHLSFVVLYLLEAVAFSCCKITQSTA